MARYRGALTAPPLRASFLAARRVAGRLAGDSGGRAHVLRRWLGGLGSPPWRHEDRSAGLDLRRQDVDVVATDLLVARDDNGALEPRLRHQQAIERITVDLWQLCHGRGVGKGDGQLLEADGGRETSDVAVEAQPTEPPLDGDLPRAHGRHEDRVLARLDRRSGIS